MNRFAVLFELSESQKHRTHFHDSSSLKEATFHSCGLHFGSLACVEAVWFWRTWLRDCKDIALSITSMFYNVTCNRSMATDQCRPVEQFLPEGMEHNLPYSGGALCMLRPYGSTEFHFLIQSASARFSLPMSEIVPSSDILIGCHIDLIVRWALRRCWRWSPWIIWSWMSLWGTSPVQVRDLTCVNGKIHWCSSEDCFSLSCKIGWAMIRQRMPSLGVWANYYILSRKLSKTAWVLFT